MEFVPNGKRAKKESRNGENIGYQYFFLFPCSFQKAYISSKGLLNLRIVWWGVILTEYGGMYISSTKKWCINEPKEKSF